MIQYDFFEPVDPLLDVKKEMDVFEDRLRRTQKRFFAQNKELMTIVVNQQKQIDELNNRITRLTKVG